MWDLVRATAMLAGRRCATGDTTTIIHTRAHLTAITELTGLRAGSSLAPAHGMAGVEAGAVVGADEAGADAGSTVAGDGATTDAALRTLRVEVFTAVGLTVVADSVAVAADSTAAEAADSMEAVVVVGSTVEAAEDSTAVAVDTGNRG